MANKTLFSNSVRKRAPKANTKNVAGGKAYSTSAEYSLAQYAVTGTFNGTYYVSAGDHLDRVKELVKQVSPEFIAKVAVYAHQKGKMKDLPAFCLAVLAANRETELLKKAWPHVITNVKMLLNFVQIIRSGVLGRKSFGSAVKRLIQDWITSRNGKQLMMAKIGHSQPSLEDVIKMVHPRPTGEEQNAMFGYICGRDYNSEVLHPVVREFEAFKRDNSLPVPDLPFRALTNCGLTETHWKEIAENMPWNTLRMNLNVLSRNNVFSDRALTKRLASKIGDESEVKKWNAFPYQLLTSFQNVGPEVPQSIKLALQDAMEVATDNVPDLGDVFICPDLSGSMSQSVTGNRGSVSSKTTLKDVVALMSAVAIRQNPEAKVIAWATSVSEVKLNPRDSVMTNAEKIKRASVGMGTSARLAIDHINKNKWKGDAIIYLSDFQSWMDSIRGVSARGSYYGYGGATGMAEGWEVFKKRNPNSKLIGINMNCHDGTTQVKDTPDVLNIPGFSDQVFDVVANFVHGDKSHFVDTINKVEL